MNSTQNRPSIWVRPLAIAGAVLGGYLMLAWGGGAPKPTPIGIPDPGAVTGWMMPTLSGLNILISVIILGATFVPLLAMRADKAGSQGELDALGLRALLTARWWLVAWLIVVVIQIVFTSSDLWATAVGQLRFELVRSTLTQTVVGYNFMAQLVFILLAIVVAFRGYHLRAVGWVLALTLTGMALPSLNGHSAASGSHDAAIVALITHVVVVAVWMAGLVALWWFLPARPHRQLVAGRRFSALAGWCFGITLISGVANTLVRLGSPVEIFTTGYGRGALAKLGLLLVVGAVAFFTRRVVLGHLEGTEAAGARLLTLLAGVELVVLTTAVGVGAGLARTPPPVGEPYKTLAESLVGGPLPPAPDLLNLLVIYKPSGVGTLVVLLGAAGYVAGLVALHRRSLHWPVGRTISWFIGLALVGYVTFGGLGAYAHVLFSAHMAQHVVLSMLAPIPLVVGAPINLALRTLPGTDADGGRGPRHWLAAILRSRYVRVITHPLVAAFLFVGSLYIVYFSSLFDWLMFNHMGHALMQVHFLAVGMLFYELIIGDAPIPNRLPHVRRILLMLAVTPFHAFFAISTMMASTVIGERFFAMLERPYATDLLRDQFVGGSITWAMGEVPMVFVAIALVIGWYRADVRAARRYDRAEDRDHDAELAAYNEMLARLDRQRQRGR